MAEDGETKILVIEDSPMHRRLIKETLHDEGFSIYECDTAEKGLEIAAEEHPQLVFIDLYLPGVDGLEAVGMLRSLEGMDQVPIVVMSASRSGRERERVMQTDCDYYLHKPINVDELPLLVKQLLKSGRELAGQLGAKASGVRDAKEVEEIEGKAENRPDLALKRERLQALEKVRRTLNHDLRTPLTIMISYAHTVSRGKVGEVNDKQREMLETVVEQGFELDAMLTELVAILASLEEAEEEQG